MKSETPQLLILIVPVLLVSLCARTLIVQIPGAKLLGSLKVIWTKPNVGTGLTSSAVTLKLWPLLSIRLIVTAVDDSPGSN